VTRDAAQLVCLPQEDEISEYELQRHRTIEKNEAFLNSLNMGDDKENIAKKPAPRGMKAPPKAKVCGAALHDCVSSCMLTLPKLTRLRAAASPSYRSTRTDPALPTGGASSSAEARKGSS